MAAEQYVVGGEQHAYEAKPGQRYPLYLSEDFTSPVETPSPFRYVAALASKQETPFEETASFKFAVPASASKYGAPEIEDFPFTSSTASKSTIGSLSLKSWSREAPVNQASTDPVRYELTTTDSFSLKPHETAGPSAETRQAPPPAPPDQFPETAENDPPLQKKWRDQVAKWRQRRKGALHSDGEMMGQMKRDASDVDDRRAKSFEHGPRPWTWTLPLAAARPLKGGNRMTRDVPSSPRRGVRRETPKASNPDFTRRLSPGFARAAILPRVQFPQSQEGSQFSLEPSRVPSAFGFNGYWKPTSGGKALQRAQSAFTQASSFRHMLEGRIHLLFIDSTTTHFRRATWTRFMLCREQRPWSGQSVVRGCGTRGDQRMSIKLDGGSVIMRTEILNVAGGAVKEILSLSPDFQTVSRDRPPCHTRTVAVPCHVAMAAAVASFFEEPAKSAETHSCTIVSLSGELL